MGELVMLSLYRRKARAHTTSVAGGRVVSLTPREQAMAVAMSCVVIDALTGVELFGVPSVYLAEVIMKADGAAFFTGGSGVSQSVLARLEDGQWAYVKDDAAHLHFAHQRGWETRRVRMVRIGTPVDVVVNEQGKAVDNPSSELVSALKAGRRPFWCSLVDGTWRPLCDGSFTAGDAAYFAFAANLGECERRVLRIVRREAGRG